MQDQPRRADPSAWLLLLAFTVIAIALVRYRIRGGEPVNFLLVLPLTAPEIVLGASLLTLFIRPTMLLFNHSFVLGTPTIIIAHIMFLVSYVAITVRARVRGLDWTLEDAAMDLGASPTRTSGWRRCTTTPPTTSRRPSRSGTACRSRSARRHRTWRATAPRCRTGASAMTRSSR